MTKCVILAGGLGSRISEETILKPKPMIEIGGKPILWHIMKLYSYYGINDFIICLGYKGNIIKDYFNNFNAYNSDYTIDVKQNKITKIYNNKSSNWKVTLIDTGLNTMTGGRILRLKNFLKKEKFFCLTYGDGVSNVNIKELIATHKKNKKLATMTVINPPGRFGAVKLNKNKITNFAEKLDNIDTYINGGFYVLSPKVFDFIKDDSTIWEKEPLQQILYSSQLAPYIHNDFWYAMDTGRDKSHLEELIKNHKARWMVWDEDR